MKIKIINVQLPAHVVNPSAAYCPKVFGILNRG